MMDILNAHQKVRESIAEQLGADKEAFDKMKFFLGLDDAYEVSGNLSDAINTAVNIRLMYEAQKHIPGITIDSEYIEHCDQVVMRALDAWCIDVHYIDVKRIIDDSLKLAQEEGLGVGRDDANLHSR